MKIHPIESADNALLKQIRGLNQRSLRDKTGLFLIKGPRALEEAIAKGVRIKDVVVSSSFLKGGGAVNAAEITEIKVVDDRLFKELVSTTTPPGIVAVAHIPSSGDLEEILDKPAALVLVADAIQDPGNLGTMVRTALAACADCVIATRGTVDPYNPKVVRAASAALFRMPVFTDLTFETMAQLCKKHNLKIVACDPEGGKHPSVIDMSGKTAIVVGNEGQGFSPAALAQVDAVVSLPMNKESESLNAAVTAGIVLFDAMRQRMMDNRK